MPDWIAGFLATGLPGTLLRVMIYAIVGSALWVSINFSTLQEYFRARDRYQNYQQTVTELQREQERLMGEQAALKDDGFPKEKAIRERFLMVKPGEEILFIERPDEGKAGGGSEPITKPRDGESAE